MVGFCRSYSSRSNSRLENWRQVMNEHNIELRDGRELKIIITDEGLTLDVYAANETGYKAHVGTQGMMFDGWADWVLVNAKSFLPYTDCTHCGVRIRPAFGYYIFDNDSVYVDEGHKDTCDNSDEKHKP